MSTLVNNAGVIWPLEEIIDVDPEEWAYNVMINLLGPFFMVRNVLPVMTDQGSGRILNISSAASTRAIVGASVYCAAKAGLDMFACTLALELTGSKGACQPALPRACRHSHAGRHSQRRHDRHAA